MFAHDELTVIIGERINPTGRAGLADDLRAGKLDMAVSDALAQADAGADYIDVNVGAAGVNEVELLPRLVKAVAGETGLPICVDSADTSALAAALKVYSSPQAIVNSVTADEESMDAVLPLVGECGCFVIGMTKDRGGIPATVDERMAMAQAIVERASSFGIPVEKVLVDCLTLPVATDTDAATITLDAITVIREKLGCPVVLGVSNVSFGMPERPLINSVFLGLAVRAGLSAAIVNPLEEGLVLSVRAADFLTGKDKMGRGYLKYYRAHKA
jgi:5-methyltetrahydrofolate--homocysteine methyltransferase